ncbi:MAG: hypothetical protein AAGH87_06605 [Pseudomonadota bacterium]
MTPNDRDSLAWSLDYAARTLAGAMARLAPKAPAMPYLARGAWIAACRELQFLELFVRRLLICLAGDIAERFCHRGLPAPEAAERAAKAAVARGGAAGSPPRGRRPAPVFPAFDRFFTKAQIQRWLDCSEQAYAPPGWAEAAPDAGTLADARPLACLARLAPMVDGRRIAERFAALAAVLADPEPHARRLARWQVRRRRSALCLGRVPTLAKAGVLDLASSSFFEAERLAVAAINRAWGGADSVPETGPAPPGAATIKDGSGPEPPASGRACPVRAPPAA